MGGAWPAAARKPFLKTKDFLVSGEDFELVQIHENGLLRTLPAPKDLSSYYQSERYISHTDGRKTVFEKLYQGVKALTLKRKEKLLRKLHGSPGKLLDFGAGTGDFLATAAGAGWVTAGVEPATGARTLGQDKGVRLWADLDNLPEGTYDIITLWHVLEHLPDPGMMVNSLQGLLGKGGHLIIAVPNYRSFDARYYRAYWAAYDTPRHLWHFTKESLENILGSEGFELTGQKPMWFDAYYVSWLSEKYRKNPLAPIGAFLVASFSNILALFTGEYSSIIYIFRKANPKS